MKTKKYYSPLLVLGSLLLIGGFSVLYLGYSLRFGNDKNYSSLISWVTRLGVIFMVASIIINGIIIGNKKARMGDEFTVKILRKVGFISFISVMIAITILFVVVQIIMGANSGYFGGIKKLIDVRVLLTAVAGIQVVGTFLYFIFSKLGDTNGF